MDRASDCLTPGDGPGTANSPRSSFIARTRALFELLATACGGSRRIAAQEIMVDPRCCDHLRNAPTIDFIARIGSGLGLDARSASGVVAAEPASRATRASILQAIAAADLLDDAVQLVRLAAELQRRADIPADLGMAQLVFARACVARGNLDGARAALELVRKLGVPAADARLAQELAESIAGDGMLGAPWVNAGMNTGMHAPVDLSGVRALIPRGGACGAPSVRARCWALGSRLISGDACAVSEYRLRDFLQVLEESTDPVDIGWAGSIVAEVALLLRSQGRCSGLRTIVTCELALEEALAVTEGAVRDHLLRRRTRIALREWSTRSALGEIDVDTIDHLDAEELARIALWFPLALRDPAIGRVVAKVGQTKFTKINRRGIDALSMHDSMSGQVQSLHATGAVAGSRSEDPC